MTRLEKLRKEEREELNEFIGGLVRQIEYENSICKLYARLLLKEVMKTQADQEHKDDIPLIVDIVRENWEERERSRAEAEGRSSPQLRRRQASVFR
jgi:hypothetical protein